jgi:hypothetical protein
MGKQFSNGNCEQRPGCDEPQAPRSISVESVDGGNDSLNHWEKVDVKHLDGEPSKESGF